MDASRTPAPQPAKGRGFLFALLAAALALAACTAPTGELSPTTQPTTTTQPTSTSQPTATVAPSAAATAAAWPRQLVDDEGTTIELDEPPERVISLSPAITEIVFALDAGDRLVGGTDFDDYPAAAVDLPDVATFTGVLHEAVVGLEPDLVIAAGNNFTPAGDIDYMRDFGTTVLVVYAETVDEVLADIRLIGQALGAEAAAERVVAQMEQRITAVTSATEALERPRVFYQIGSEPEIYAPAPKSFLADMVTLAGGDPITTGDPAVFSISVEQLVAQDPEVIVLGDAAYGVCPQNVVERPGWTAITAVREGAVRPVEDVIITRPGPRLAEGLAALALAIHPELDIEPPPGGAPLCAEGWLSR